MENDVQKIIAITIKIKGKSINTSFKYLISFRHLREKLLKW